MSQNVSKELLEKYNITEEMLSDYLAQYGKNLHIYSCMSPSTQIAWCEETAAYELEQKELKRRKERKQNK